MQDLDQFDIGILKRLQEDARLTSEVLGAEIGLSSTAVQRRIKRLRESGAIAREVAVVSPDAVGRGMTALIGVEMAMGGRTDLVDDFKRRMLAQPEVQQCYYVGGDHDFILIVTAKDMADYERLTRRLFFNVPNVKKFHTTFVIDAVKVGLHVPLD